MPLLKRSGPAAAPRISLAGCGCRARRTPDLAARNRRAGMRQGLFEACANPGCDSGWLQLWRSRSAPVFEGGWNCSPECTAAAAAGRRPPRTGRARERVASESHRHRMPLGLLMLEQGWITAAQLRGALEASEPTGAAVWAMARAPAGRQRAAGDPRAGPAVELPGAAARISRPAKGLTPLLPRLFVDAFGALPLRVAAGKLVYLGFEERLDPALALALERMTACGSRAGWCRVSQFRPAHTRMLEAKFPPWSCWRQPRSRRWCGL